MNERIVTSGEIGKAIKLRRRELGISQERLAEILNVSYQQVQRYENGSNKLNVENIQMIAHALNVSITSFFSPVVSATVSELKQNYTPEDETNLLKYFRNITNRRNRSLVVGVARMATEQH